MTEPSHKFNHATIEWRNNQPYASTFQDVYFSSDDGLAETDYVFLQGNQLLQRWQSLSSDTFTIIETGFGTGLNFLCAAQLWLENAPSHASLQFYSVEKYPIDLANKQYAKLLNGTEIVTLFNNRVTLHLLIGEATEQLATIQQPADAWFLDGFAPSKNPDMWQASLFAQMAKLSNQSTTFATFTSAGDVRRGLTAAGFTVYKRTGFGKKREMLHGKFLGPSHG
jgi:tRNA 5-methylaminomethyl-2-thiouridine biosynthesis bifunctional protein